MNREGSPSHPDEHWSDDDFAALSAYLKNPEAFAPSTVQPPYLDTLLPDHSAFSRALNDIMATLKNSGCEVPALIDAYMSFQHLTRSPITRNAIRRLLEHAQTEISDEEYSDCHAILLTTEVTQIFALERGQNADAKKAVLRNGLITWLVMHRPDENNTLYGHLLEFVDKL